ncbi:DUF421 domain-containing protein [Helcococcus kunzii]
MFQSILIKLIIGYLALLVVVRIVGKKSLSKMTPLDLAYTIVLGGILEEAIYEDKVGIKEILFALFVWAFVIYIFEVIMSNSQLLSRILQGKPSVIIFEGKLVYPTMKRNKIEMQQLRQMLRNHECFSLYNANTLILENSGNTTLIKKDDDDKELSYLLVDDSKINQNTLKSIHLTEDDLMSEINKLNLKLEDLIYVEWTVEKGYYFIKRDDMIQHKINIE